MKRHHVVSVFALICGGLFAYISLNNLKMEIQQVQFGQVSSLPYSRLSCFFSEDCNPGSDPLE